MNKIKIVGVRNLPYDGELDPNMDYVVSLVAALDEIRTKTKQGEEEEEKIFVLKTLYIDSVKDQNKTPLPIQKGFTPSQQLRFAIMDYLRRAGIDPTEEQYEKEMKKIIDYYDKKGI